MKKLSSVCVLAGLVLLLVVPATAGVIFQDDFETPVLDPGTTANAPNWALLGGIGARMKVIRSDSSPAGTIAPQIFNGAQSGRANTAQSSKQGGQHDFNLTEQRQFYHEIWWWSGGLDASGQSDAFQGMGLTLNLGGETFGANWLALGCTGSAKGLPNTNFHYRARYGVNWGNGAWLDTGLAIPTNKWVKLAVGYINTDPTQTAGEYTNVYMSISWDGTVQWSRWATMDNGIIGKTVTNAQIGTLPGLTAWAVGMVDDYAAYDTMIPEPASITALLSGLACIGLIRVRRKS